MRKISGYLREKYGPWGWLGQRAHDAEGINRVLPLDFIISCDYGLDVPYYFNEDDVFSIEKNENIRRDWSNEHLNDSLKGSLGREIFARWNDYDRRINLVCYRSVKKLEMDQRSLLRKPAVYAAPESLKKRFDNKVHLCRRLAGSPLPAIPSVVKQLGKVCFRELRRELSLPFVVQLPYGSSGNGTFIIREEGQFNNVSRIYAGRTVSIRRYIKGFSLNVNGIIISTEKGPVTFCSFPSVQIVGARECSNSPASFCGNDYASARALNKDLLKQVEHGIKVIGGWMAESGFRGIFGMDFAVGGGKVYPVEINPRFQNSTSLYTVLEGMQKSRGSSLFLLHIAEFLQKNDKKMRKYVKDFPKGELMDPVKGSQIILHNRMRRNIVTGDLYPGVYRREGGRLRFVREGVSLVDCIKPDEVLITCAVPKPFTVVEPNAPICKIQMLKGVLDPVNKRELSAEVKKIVSSVYDKLGLKDASREVVHDRT